MVALQFRFYVSIIAATRIGGNVFELQSGMRSNPLINNHFLNWWRVVMFIGVACIVVCVAIFIGLLCSYLRYMVVLVVS